MSGTKEGGKKTAETNKKKYGEDYYSKIGVVGGVNKNKKTQKTDDLPSVDDDDTDSTDESMD